MGQMQPYANNQGHSGVIAYAIGKSYIDVEFVGGSIYRYDYDITGEDNVKQMKILARQGSGLSTFISKTVHNNYAAQIK
jgi:hypothetical protein